MSKLEEYMKKPYRMTIIPEEEGIFTLYFPDLPGCITTGETPEKAACREVKEELGIIINPENLKLGFEHIIDWDDGTGLLVSVFMCRINVPDDGFKFDHYEVNDVKIMPFHEFFEHISDHNDKGFCDKLKEIDKIL